NASASSGFGRRCERMPFTPPDEIRGDQRDHRGQSDPARDLVRQTRDAVKLITDEIADRHDQRTPNERAEHVPSEELQERHSARAGHRTRHKSHARDKSRHEYGLAPVGAKEELQSIVARTSRWESRGDASEHAL